MKMFEAIRALEYGSTVLINQKGDRFQKHSDNRITVVFSKEEEEGSPDGSMCASETIDNDLFVEKYGSDTFEVEEQWYDKSGIKFPVLCWVTTPSWQFAKKAVLISSRSGDLFNTGFGESYIVSASTKIVPVSDDELEAFKRGY